MPARRSPGRQALTSDLQSCGAQACCSSSHSDGTEGQETGEAMIETGPMSSRMDSWGRLDRSGGSMGLKQNVLVNRIYLGKQPRSG